MARVNLVFEDAEDGAIAFHANLYEGFDRASHAHALAARVIHFLEDEKVSKVLTETPKASDTIVEPRRIIY